MPTDQCCSSHLNSDCSFCQTLERAEHALLHDEINRRLDGEAHTLGPRRVAEWFDTASEHKTARLRVRRLQIHRPRPVWVWSSIRRQ